MPSAINEMMLAEVKAVIGDSQSMILVDASRLKSDENLKLRKDLRGVGARLKVAKVALLHAYSRCVIGRSRIDSHCPKQRRRVLDRQHFQKNRIHH